MFAFFTILNPVLLGLNTVGPNGAVGAIVVM